jgi:hypothetical protein
MSFDEYGKTLTENMERKWKKEKLLDR